MKVVYVRGEAILWDTSTSEKLLHVEWGDEMAVFHLTGVVSWRLMSDDASVRIEDIEVCEAVDQCYVSFGIPSKEPS